MCLYQVLVDFFFFANYSFLNTATATSNSVPEIHKNICRRYHIPLTFWSPEAHEASSFFGTDDDWTVSGDLENYRTFFQFLVKQPTSLPASHPSSTNGQAYDWQKLRFHTYWRPMTSCIILCFDLPPVFKAALKHSVQTSSCELASSPFLRDPYMAHAKILECVTTQFDKAVWSWRDLVRGIEKNNRLSLDGLQVDYGVMHDIARHVLHSSEMLAVTISTVKNIMDEHTAFHCSIPLNVGNNVPFRSGSKGAVAEARKVDQSLHYHSSLLYCIHLRSQALEKRLQNEINLVSTIAPLTSFISQDLYIQADDDEGV